VTVESRLKQTAQFVSLQLTPLELVMVLPEGIQIHPTAPNINDYLRLRDIAGLSPFTPSAAEVGLAGTYFGVSILFEETIVGMGRIDGDGGLFFQIVDIAVDPDYQGRGQGFSVMSALMEHPKKYAPPSAHVSLLADVPAHKLYEKIGFATTAPQSIGMATRIEH
jgi:ribosomal protein S18 acetylase RimI-like enzyme